MLKLRLRSLEEMVVCNKTAFCKTILTSNQHLCISASYIVYINAYYYFLTFDSFVVPTIILYQDFVILLTIICTRDNKMFTYDLN